MSYLLSYLLSYFLSYFIKQKNVLLFVLFFVLKHKTTTKTKTNSLELGVRFGNDFSIDAAVPFAKAGRLHPSVTINDGGATVATYVDWMLNLNEASGLALYYGVGPEFYFYSGFDFGIAGDFGMEYAFQFPLTIGFDWRPGFILTNSFDFQTSNWGFTARWRF